MLLGARESKLCRIWQEVTCKDGAQAATSLGGWPEAKTARLALSDRWLRHEAISCRIPRRPSQTLKEVQPRRAAKLLLAPCSESPVAAEQPHRRFSLLQPLLRPPRLKALKLGYDILAFYCAAGYMVDMQS